MRRNPTSMEIAVGDWLRDLGFRPKRQVLLYGYIADSYLPEAGVVVEADGPIHEARVLYDQRRDAHLAAHDLLTFRVTPERLRDPRVGEFLVALVEARRHKWARRKRPAGPRRMNHPCLHCGHRFGSQHTLDAHLRTAHAALLPKSQPASRDGAYGCVCGGAYRTCAELAMHQAARHPRLIPPPCT